MTYYIYGIIFFLITLLIQYLMRNYINRGGHLTIWLGFECVIIICILGIIQKELYYFAAIIGFVIADQIGKAAGWHK